MNASNSRVTVEPLKRAEIRKVPKHDFGHFRVSEQHADGCISLATYDFLHYALVLLATLDLSWTVVEL